MLLVSCGADIIEIPLVLGLLCRLVVDKNKSTKSHDDVRIDLPPAAPSLLLDLSRRPYFSCIYFLILVMHATLVYIDAFDAYIKQRLEACQH